MKTTAFFIPLLTASYVSAHGFLRTLTINNQAYTGNIPAGTDSPSVIRQVSTTFPNKGASNPALTCGANSTAGTLVANANPGDSLSFNWKGADLSNWPHNTGPMLTYLANCGSTTCDQFDITNAKWFKIQQIGKKPNGSDWAQVDIMNGGVATATLPSTLAPGNYLLRHEIIALHLAVTLGGAEFYPACAQIKVGGSQTGAPNPDELVSLPGAYTDNDPGIFDPNVFTPGAPYTFPGPPIASFVGGGTSTGGTSGGNSTTPTTSGSASSPTQTPKSSSKSCKIKRSKTLSAAVSGQRRHLSRVMRRLAFGESHH
jgi:hypothetical protein